MKLHRVSLHLQPAALFYQRLSVCSAKDADSVWFGGSFCSFMVGVGVVKGINIRQAKKSATGPQPHLPVTPAILRQLCQFWEAEMHNPDHNMVLWAACCMRCFRIWGKYVRSATIST